MRHGTLTIWPLLSWLLLLFFSFLQGNICILWVTAPSKNKVNYRGLTSFPSPTHTHTHTQAHTHRHTHRHTDTCTHTHARTFIHIYTHTNTKHTHAHARLIYCASTSERMSSFHFSTGLLSTGDFPWLD